MENIIIAVISGIAAIVVAFIGVTRKGVRTLKARTDESMSEDSPSPAQNQRLIETLNSTVEAQIKQVEILRGIVDQQRIQLEDKDREIHDLNQRVSNLERLTIEQALIIRELEKLRVT